MKKIFVLLISVLTISQGFSQLTSFSREQDQFLKELSEFMRANNNEIGKDSYEKFAKMVEAGNILPEQLDLVIDLSNKMLERKMKPMPQFVAVLNATVAFSKSGQLMERYSEWMVICNTILDNSNLPRSFSISGNSCRAWLKGCR